MRTRGLRFISRGTRVVALPKKKKKKKIANERKRRSKFLARHVSCLTRRFEDSGRSLERACHGKGVECRTSHRRDGRRRRGRRRKRLQPWLSADFRNYRVESRGLSGSTRGRVSYRAPEASEHTMESRVYRVTTMIRVPLRFK